MRIKAIIGLIILTLFFIGGGIHITTSNDRAIQNLEKVVGLNEVAHRRADLLNKIKLVQAHLLLADSPHVTNIDSVVLHGEAIKMAAERCFDCHHSPEVSERFYQLQESMNDYLKQLSRVYTIRANRPRLVHEINEAFASGERLYTEVDSLSTLSAHRIPIRISQVRDEISRAKQLILGLVITGPVFALILISLFVKRFTTSISVLTRATGRIREGDLTHRINESLEDEFGELAAAFNQMTSSLRQQREQLLAAESRYKILFESAVDAIFILEAEGERRGTIVAANPAAAEMHGYRCDELIGLSIQDLDTSASAAEAPERFRRLLNGEKIGGQVEHRRKDGTIFPVEFSAGLVEIEGKKYVLAFDRDISLRVRTEEALERSRQLALVGEMAAGLAHEIKNPLAGIKVSMQVLVNELTLEPEDREIFLRIVREIERIENLLRNLLNYARPPRPAFAPLDLNAHLETSLRNAEMMLKSPEFNGEKRKLIHFERHLAPVLPQIKADAAQLQQIFLNLLLNAVEAITGEGTISLTTRPGPPGTVAVEVTDNGKGISPEALDAIFQPFYTNKPKGNGLGLAISKRLVDMHQGTIEVVSEPGRGTTFTLSFPEEQQPALEEERG